MASSITAASAYANIARLTANPGLGIGSPQGGEGGATGFASILKEALASVGETGRKSDAQAQALATGKSNMVDVVTAVAETEVAISAVVAVRDRVIQAYEEIMKMPI